MFVDSLKGRVLGGIGVIIAATTLTAIAPAVIAGPLMFDVDDRASNITQAGWTPVTLDGINGVTFTAVNAVLLDDRDRGDANTNALGGDAANNNMWRDFVFADPRPDSDAVGNGMDISVTGLVANTSYAVRLWAFDELSNGGRHMTWNGNALSIPTTGDPTSLTDQVVSFLATSDTFGELVLHGRTANPVGPCCNVFVNGFELTAVPEPGTLGLLGLGIIGLGLARRKRA